MFESIINFFKNIGKTQKEQVKSKDAAKERLHLVLMQDRANVSADFLDLMKQEIIEVIKKYIEVDENAIDVRLTNKDNGDGTTGAPALYANIPIMSIKEEVKSGMSRQKQAKKEEIKEVVKENKTNKPEKDTENKETKKANPKKDEKKKETVKEEKQEETKKAVEEKTKENSEVVSEAKKEENKEEIEEISEVKENDKKENKQEEVKQEDIKEQGNA